MMVWRKRRRYRLANLVSYLCVALGAVFIIGNVIMLREGFVQLYVTAFGEHTSLPSRELRKPKVTHAYDSFHRDKWRESRYYYKLAVMDLPRVELPSSAMAAELRLRKLMDDENDMLRRVRPQPGNRELNPEDIRYLHENEVLSGRPPHGVSVISVSSRDLRSSLHVTSDCSGLQNLTDISVVGSGWTKVVYKTNYREVPVALKTVDLSGHDLVTCKEKNKSQSLSECYENVVLKLLKEILLLKGLDHPHVVQVMTHCVPDIPYNGRHDSMVTLATELGDSIDIIKILHMAWEDRLKISYGLTKLLHYLAHSPYGSVLLNDFRRQQFVLVDGDIKLTDLDDMTFTERSCLVDADCTQYYSSVNLTLKSQCISSQCLGLNERINIFNAARHFTTFLLPHGAPRALREPLDQLVSDFNTASKTARELLQGLLEVIDHYSTGAYLNRTATSTTSYRVVTGSDMPGLFDYSCMYCMGGSGCTVSVFDVREAEELCTSDTQCRAFVLTNKHTWTGRMIAHLKNGVGAVTRDPRTTLYIKPTV